MDPSPTTPPTAQPDAEVVTTNAAAPANAATQHRRAAQRQQVSFATAIDGGIGANKRKRNRRKSRPLMDSRTHERKAVLPTAIICGIIIAGLEIASVILDDRHVWGFCQTEVSEHVRWCEAEDADLTKFMIEPANARSNYAYFIFGVYMIVWGHLCRRKVIVQELVAYDNTTALHRQLQALRSRVLGDASSDGSNDHDNNNNTNTTIPVDSEDMAMSSNCGSGSDAGSDVEAQREGHSKPDEGVDAAATSATPAAGGGKAKRGRERPNNAKTGPKTRKPTFTRSQIHLAAHQVAFNWNAEQRESTVTTTARHTALRQLEELNTLHRFPLLIMTFGCSMALLGFGSWWFHASECPSANHWDAAGMFTSAIFPILYCMVSVSPFPRRCAFLITVVQILLFMLEFTVDLDNTLMVVILVGSSYVAIGVLTFVRRRTHTYSYKMLAGSAFFGVASFVVWMLDINKTICNDRVGGHAFWHIGTCMSTVCVVLYLRSERMIIQVEDESNDDGDDGDGVAGDDDDVALQSSWDQSQSLRHSTGSIENPAAGTSASFGTR